MQNIKGVNKQILMAVFVTLLTAGMLGFFSGRLYEQHRMKNRLSPRLGGSSNTSQNQRDSNRQFGGPFGGGEGPAFRSR